MKIILVCIKNFQEYILDNIKNLIDHGNTDIDVITEEKFFNHFYDLNITLVNTNTLNDYNFNKKSKLDKNYRGGFWHLCSLRLFYLYSYIQSKNIKNCLHIENDVMLYKNLTNYEFNTDKISTTFDCYNRVIPSIIYIPTPDHFKVIIEKYNPSLNDMQNLSKFDENIIERLPIYTELKTNEETYSVTHNFDKYNIIFDAAAIGQYLSGVDTRNISGDTRGFVNETCIIKYKPNQFFWIKDNINSLYYPYIFINNKAIPIFNLHIHSKNLKDFMSLNPIEQKYIKIL
jgi:hypothetical protein